VAAYIVGHVGNPARFPTPQRFASYNGTGPIEASSGPRKRHRLDPRGNRKLNHAMRLIALTPIRNDTRAGTTSNATWPRANPKRKPPRPEAPHQRRRLAPTPSRPRGSLTSGPGGQSGGDPESSAAGLHPDTGTSAQATPGPTTTPLRPPARACFDPPTHPLDTRTLRSRTPAFCTGLCASGRLDCCCSQDRRVGDPVDRPETKRGRCSG
jgi:transposase